MPASTSLVIITILPTSSCQIKRQKSKLVVFTGARGKHHQNSAWSANTRHKCTKDLHRFLLGALKFLLLLLFLFFSWIYLIGVSPILKTTVLLYMYDSSQHSYGKKPSRATFRRARNKHAVRSTSNLQTVMGFHQPCSFSYNRHVGHCSMPTNIFHNTNKAVIQIKSHQLPYNVFFLKNVPFHEIFLLKCLKKFTYLEQQCRLWLSCIPDNGKQKITIQKTFCVNFL